MCGFVVLFDRAGRRPVDTALLARMTRALAHRGPDGEGFHVEPGLGLGHRRLAIVDRAGGAQPLFDARGDVGIVFNGEIYGHAALAARLRAAGHRFTTRSDTETILHAWEEWGEACVERLDGMFAFVLWDRRRGQLFAARDRLGEKPLHYALLPDGQMALASEIKALALHPRIDLRVAPRAIEEFFAFGYVPEPQTIHAGIAKLAPGHTISFRRAARAAPEPRRYWRPVFAPDATATPEAATRHLAAALDAAVCARLASEVPFGAFLSGGLDSSAVVAAMAANGVRPVRSFAIGFRQRDLDETAHAAAVAAHLGTAHRSRIVELGSLEIVDRIAAIHDEPFGDASAIPTLAVAMAAREEVTVVLTGDGADEIFAGYRRHLWQARTAPLRALLPESLRRSVFAALAAAYPKADWAPRPLRAKATFAALALDPLAAYFRLVAVMPDEQRLALFSPRLRDALDGHRAIAALARHAADAPTGDPLAWAQYLDLTTWLPGAILTKLDRATMAVGLEARAPFLDHRLVEWAGTLPASLKLRGGQGKWVLRRAAAAALPPAIATRAKQGFVAPIAAWFRGAEAGRLRSLLLGGALADSGDFAQDAVARLIDRHRAGLGDHARALWLLLVYEAFLRRAAGTRLADPAAA